MSKYDIPRYTCAIKRRYTFYVETLVAGDHYRSHSLFLVRYSRLLVIRSYMPPILLEFSCRTITGVLRGIGLQRQNYYRSDTITGTILRTSIER